MMKSNSLWIRIQQHDELALKELFNLYYKPLCSYTVQFTQRMPDAEDLVQSVFVKLWMKRESLTINTSIKSYLYKAVYNAYIDKFRKNKKKEDFFENLKYEAMSFELEDDENELHAKIEKLKSIVNDLPERCKEILLLSKWEGYKHREIAEQLNISLKTVEGQLRIAYIKIRKGFDKDDKLILFFLK
ncbi:RNA polymerase sigma factor [uncultured Polaribacter sp.]|uniref:RNA polymerase sigma factor n=1 Tax=uncultured Polaribacter sp. TaxID=174711 RepID=UPI00262C160F|nr:RNA polymerase sigma-70 factor [uncultured Polaribacter sp.]